MRGAVFAAAVPLLAGLWIRWEQAQEQAWMASQPEPLSPELQVAVADPGGAIERFARALTFRTVGNATVPGNVGDARAFQGLREHLEASFPLTWERLRPEAVGEHSLLFTWAGSDAGLAPGLLLAHLDVVPAGDEALWTHPPFSGAVRDGFVWGRGALDIKVSLVAILEAVEELLAAGGGAGRPERTVLLAFGHDEELGGGAGAAAIAALLRSRGVRELAYVLDEGGTVLTDGFPPLTSTPVALVGTAEKGMATVEVTARGSAGHSSMPPLDGSAAGSVLGRFLSRLDKAPINPDLVPPTNQLMEALAPAAPLPLRPLLRAAAAGRGSLAGYLLAQAVGSASKEGAALVRTTVAATRFSGGVAANVLPGAAGVTINSRTVPGETAADVLEYLNVTGGGTDSARLDLKLLAGGGWDPSPVSDWKGPAFAALRRAAIEAFSEPGRGRLLVAPYLCVGATDARHYVDLAPDAVFRFAPLRMDRAAGDVQRIHGVDERIAVGDYLRAVVFFKRFLTLSANVGG